MAFQASQPGLELIVLNGCINLKQAEGYHQAGARAVIATDTYIGGEAARAFAELLYQGWPAEQRPARRFKAPRLASRYSIRKSSGGLR